MGMEVIAEDYIQCKCTQKSFIGLIKFINITTFLFLIFAIIFGFTKVNDTSIENRLTQNVEETQ